MTHRLAVFATHPTQYHVPVWRSLARTPGVDLKVFYFSDRGVRRTLDPGFGVHFAWDIPLLNGYEYELLANRSNVANKHWVGITAPEKLLRQGHYDWVVVQGYTHRFEWQLIRAAKRAGINVLMRGEFADYGKVRGYLKAYMRDCFLRWLYLHVDAFCYVGIQARKHLLRLGVPETKLFFSPYSVDTDLLEYQRKIYDRTACRAELGLTGDCFAFLFSGKLTSVKCPSLLIDALQLFANRDRVALIVLGDGPLRHEVLQRGTVVLGSHFLFRGFVNQSELGRYFAAADALVLPSSYETWGLVVNEAMQFALPVITTDHVNCQPDLVIPGETGFVFPPGDKVRLANLMQRLVEDPYAATRMGENARRHVQQYSTEASVQGVLRAIGL